MPIKLAFRGFKENDTHFVKAFCNESTLVLYLLLNAVFFSLFSYACLDSDINEYTCFKESLLKVIFKNVLLFSTYSM